MDISDASKSLVQLQEITGISDNFGANSGLQNGDSMRQVFPPTPFK